MRAIVKRNEPGGLTKHRKTSHCDYGNYGTDDKQELREALVKEQRGLCCYCMGRLNASRDSMKIEHWQCQESYPTRQLDYSNLLGACLGGEGQPGHKQHCDTRKGVRDIKFNPADLTHNIEQRVRFELNGTIRSNDSEFSEQLTDVLNLNLPLFKNRRKSVLDSILDWWRREKARLRGPVPRELIDKERRRRLGDGSRDLAPFDFVAVWWLDQRIG